MKNLITIMIMLLVGCATTPTMESVVGSYELQKDSLWEGSLLVLLEDGKIEFYNNGDKSDEGTFKIIGKEVHVPIRQQQSHLRDFISVLKIEPDGDLTAIAKIYDGIRKELPNEAQRTWKKVKQFNLKKGLTPPCLMPHVPQGVQVCVPAVGGI